MKSKSDLTIGLGLAFLAAVLSGASYYKNKNSLAAATPDAAAIATDPNAVAVDPNAVATDPAATTALPADDATAAATTGADVATTAPDASATATAILPVDTTTPTPTTPDTSAASTPAPATDASATSTTPAATTPDTSAASTPAATPEPTAAPAADTSSAGSSGSGITAEEARRIGAEEGRRVAEELLAKGGLHSSYKATKHHAAAKSHWHAASVGAKKYSAEATPEPSNAKNWWGAQTAGQFGLSYVGQLEKEKAIAMLFTDAPSAKTVNSATRVLDASGKEVSGEWEAGKNPRVFVFKGVEAGKYTVLVAPIISNLNGKTMPKGAHGAVTIAP